MKDRLMPLFFPKKLFYWAVSTIFAMPLNGNIYKKNLISSLLLYSNEYSLGVKFA